MKRKCMQTSRCHQHWFQTNWTYHLSPHYFNGSKIIVTAFKYISEQTMPKLSVNFGSHISQDFHKNHYLGPVCNFGFTAPQYSDKCLSNLPLKCLVFLTDNTHRNLGIILAIIRFTLWLVCLEPVTKCWWRSIIK